MGRGRSRQPPFRQQRTTVFVGCEGQSERGYVTLLSRVLSDFSVFPNVALAITAEALNPGAGDPEQLLKKAVRIADRAAYSVKAVLLDEDRFLSDPRKAIAAQTIAQRHNFRLILQRPSHEAFLLRHLPGCANLRPASDRCEGELVRRWPDYSKPMTAQKLAAQIGWDQIRSASKVENDLETFLKLVGLERFL